MNTSLKFSAFIFAFLLVGAGCFGAKTVSDSGPKVEVDQTREIEEVTADAEDENRASAGSQEEVKADDNVQFKMVSEDQAETFNKDDYLTRSTTESQTLKMDLDGDGVHEYALIYTDDNVKVREDDFRTIQYLNVYKWNGDEWVTIKEDQITQEGSEIDNGWFSRYEVIDFDKGNHVLYVSKQLSKSKYMYYIFGQQPDGSYGDFPIEKAVLNPRSYIEKGDDGLSFLSVEFEKNGFAEINITKWTSRHGYNDDDILTLFFPFDGEKFLSPSIVTK